MQGLPDAAAAIALGARADIQRAAPAGEQRANSHPSCTQATTAVIHLQQQSLAHSLWDPAWRFRPAHAAISELSLEVVCTSCVCKVLHSVGQVWRQEGPPRGKPLTDMDFEGIGRSALRQACRPQAGTCRAVNMCQPRHAFPRWKIAARCNDVPRPPARLNL